VPRLERQIEGLDAALVERVVEQFLVLEPEARAILLTGSYATGTAAVASDLDLVALTPSPRTPYRTWFENERTDTPLHVSAGATTVGAWVAKGTTPARWSLGFPAINTAVYLWTDDETRGRLGDDHPYDIPRPSRSLRTSSTSC
jgi:hypothetical protein